MAKTAKTLGANEYVDLYIENKKAGGDFKLVKKASRKHNFYEGEDEYLGDGPVTPWQRYKNSEGQFEIDDRDTVATMAIEDAILQADMTGQSPDIKLVYRTMTNGGAISKEEFSDVVLKPSKDVGGKGERVTRSYDWVGVKVFA